MRFDLITIFPEFFAGPLDHGIVRRAREAGIAEINIQDLREFTKDKHRTVDDRPFGGGEGMVLKPEPLFQAVEKLLGQGVGDAHEPRLPAPDCAIVLMSAAGRLFTQETARRYARLRQLVLICGRYEGVDERVAEHLATEEVSVGDYVLSGGEMPAAMIIDAVTRLLPGALGNEASTENESFEQYAERAPSGRVVGYQSCAPRLSALHAACRVSRLESAGRACWRQSCRSRQVAAPAGFRENPSQSSGFTSRKRLGISADCRYNYGLSLMCMPRLSGSAGK